VALLFLFCRILRVITYDVLSNVVFYCFVAPEPLLCSFSISRLERLLSFLHRLSDYLLFMGIPGLFAITFIDSAAVPLAGGPDTVILLLAWQRPTIYLLIGLVAAVGSTLGCLVLYGIGRKGGEKALSKFDPRKKEWIETRMREYGFWIILASVIAPPPFPTKLAILAAGVLRTSRIKLLAGAFLGRLLRYSALAYLGAEFGDDAAKLIKAHYPAISLALIIGLLLVLTIRSIYCRRMGPQGTSANAD
jgi:membrane protein YqaA with SNARE-associated domain